MVVENLEFEIAQKGDIAASGLDRLAESLKKVTSSLTPKKISTFTQRLTELNTALDSLQNANVERIERLAGALTQLAAVRGNLGFNSRDVRGLSNISEPPTPTQDADNSESLFGKIGDRLKGIVGAAKSASAAIKSFGKALSLSNTKVGQFISGLKRIAMYRVMRTIIKEITEAFTEGLKNSYLFSQGITSEGHRFSVAMDSMTSASEKMKNQLGSALISLLTAIQPIINTIINLVTMAANAIAQLFAAFTGGTYLKANDVTKQFAENTAAGGKAAKEWKNQLLGFDEINRLNDTGNSGGGGASPLDPSQMFEDAPIKQSIKDFVDSLKAAAAAGDWYGVGAIIGGKLNEVIGSLDTANWGKVLSEKIHHALQLAIGFFETFDSYGLGIKFREFFANIDWGTLASDVAELLGAMLGSAINLAVSLLSAPFQKIYDFFKGKIDEWRERLPDDSASVAFAIIAGLLDGIITGLIGIGTWIYDHIFKPFYDGICNAFQIHSPSRVMVDVGKNIIAGLLEGITERWNNLRSSMQEKWNSLKTWWQGLSLGSFQFKTPHLQVSYEPISGFLSQFLGVTALPHLSVSWYAKGGIVDGASLIGAGEAGAEAIVPLENNTEWLDKIADRLVAALGGGNDRPVDVRVFLDSREIKAGQQRLNRAMGV